MTPPRKDRDLTDTDEHEAIRQEEIATQAAEKALAKIATPMPHGMSKEEVLGLVTSQVSNAMREWEGAHMHKCSKDGPACDVKQQLEDRIERMEEAQSELGRTLGAKLDNLTEKVGGILLESAGRKGERGTWAVIRFVATPVVVAVLVWVLNWRASEDTVRKQAEIAAQVAKQLLVDQARRKPPQEWPQPLEDR